MNEIEEICPHFDGPIKIRNPKGFCDHLYYPEYCDICKCQALIDALKFWMEADYKRYGELAQYSEEYKKASMAIELFHRANEND